MNARKGNRLPHEAERASACRFFFATFAIFAVELFRSARRTTMNKLKVIAVSTIILALVAGLLAERQSRIALREDMLSLKSELERLEERVAASHPAQTAARESPPAATSADETGKLLALRAQMSELLRRLSALEAANAAVSNSVPSAKGADVAFVYPDATRRSEYAFSGYSTPQSAFQSVLWAITQLDARTFQASIAGDVAAGFASQFQDLPEGVMPGGFENGAMFKASGYRVLEEMPLSDEELRLKIFLEGSRVVIKPVLRRIEGEWKWARNDR